VRSGCKHTYEGKNKGAENCDTLSKMDARKWDELYSCPAWWKSGDNCDIDKVIS
jgi:hypothetical protein